MSNLCRVHTGCNSIVQSESFEIAGKYLTARRNNFVGNKYTFFTKFIFYLRAFSSGCGTHIKHCPIGININTFCRSHCTWFLNINHTCVMDRMISDFIIIKIISVFNIGDFFTRDVTDSFKFVYCDFISIDSERTDRGVVNCFFIFFIFITEKRFHTGYKFFW